MATLRPNNNETDDASEHACATPTASGCTVYVVGG